MYHDVKIKVNVLRMKMLVDWDFLFKFLLKKISFSNVLKLSLLHFFDTTFPAVENTRSHGTEEAGVPRNCKESRKRFGLIVFWLSQYLIGSWDLAICQVLLHLLDGISFGTFGLPAHFDVVMLPKVT